MRILAVGTVLPDTVELYAAEVPDIDTKYSHVMIGDQTVLVDPGTRKIVHIMK